MDYGGPSIVPDEADPLIVDDSPQSRDITALALARPPKFRCGVKTQASRVVYEERSYSLCDTPPATLTTIRVAREVNAVQNP